MTGDRHLEWHVDAAADGFVALDGHADGGAEIRARVTFKLGGDATNPRDNDKWDCTLSWPDDGRGYWWNAYGKVLARDQEWRILVMTLRASPKALLEGGVLPDAAITAKVLRSVPLGLIHDALATLTIPQVVAADAVQGGRAGIGNVPEGWVPELRLEDPREDAHRGTELRYVTRILSLLDIPVLTRQPPLLPDGTERQPWPAPTARTSGRPPRSDADLFRFAAAFLVAGGVYRTVCAELEMPLETARGWVKACRAAGWLAPGAPGRRAAARPGPRMLALVKVLDG